MTDEEFEAKYAAFLNRFDDLFDTKENYLRIAADVAKDKPNASDEEKRNYLEHFLQIERTNNLVRLALKDFLLHPETKD
ncbi:MAG: hypothetical protein ABF624_02095 [Liquorilactobacillus ghanensis]|uniref:hypothetical protein n=1 Tax=Liquorilactobacillus ghanensis TaxID=399370 RepID=UPI0039EC7E33